MRSPFFAAIILVLGAVSCSRGEAWMDTDKTPEQRAKALVKAMTLEEKVGQLLCPLGWPMYTVTATNQGQNVAENPENGTTATNQGRSVAVSEAYKDFIDKQHGGMLWATFRADPWTQKTIETGLNPQLAAKTYNALQKYAIEHSRLGIPIILAEEAPHGHMAIGTTVFPTSIGLASTWNPETLTEVGRTIAEELRAQGGHIGYGPVIDLAREPRWSRVEETYGEDVYLTSQMASGMVRGTSPKENGWDKGVISTLKHFIAYGIPQGGHNGNESVVGERDLAENFLPTFKAAIDAGALSVMTSYNTIDGIPSTANPKLLRNILKEDWGFQGFVVSDLYSIDGICTDHRIAKDSQEAGIMAVNAGVDVDLGGRCYAELVEALGSDSKLSASERKTLMASVDEACYNVLKIKFALGLFDNPYIDENPTTVRSEAHIAVAKKAALEGIVLLENNGVLPLNPKQKIAVVGPNADTPYNQLGDYTAPQERSNIVTPLDGIRAKAPNAVYAKGCYVRDRKASNIAAAVNAARGADVVVAVVGGSSSRYNGAEYEDTGAAKVATKSAQNVAGAPENALAATNKAQNVAGQLPDPEIPDMDAGEGFDRATLDLLGDQLKLLEALKQTGKPIIVVYIEGRPLDKVWASENADALLTMWYPGQQGGAALADVLFGEYNPAGRLPVSVPRSVGQIPVYYNKRFPVGHDYVEMSAEPLYPFGYGLSYTTFEYSDFQADSEGASVKVTNTGEMDGDEVVQIYITDVNASTARPRKQLCGFKRVHIKAGESATVEFPLSDGAFQMCNADMQMVVEPGEFTLAVGASSKDIRAEKTINIK